MLVIERRVNECIDITTAAGERIVVQIARIRSAAKKVDIGITAPRDVRIDRREVTERRDK